MNELIYQEIPEHLREQELRAQDSKVEEGTYKKNFSEVERSEKNAEYVKRSGEIFRLEQDYKQKISDMNADLKKQKGELSEMLQIVDNGFINTSGKLYLFDDQNAGDMYIYDASGVLVEKRRLKPDEREFLSFRKIGGE